MPYETPSQLPTAKKEIYKLYGVPGSGKTKRLIEFIRKKIQNDGVSPDKICYITFTRSAVMEAKNRITSAIPELEKRDFSYFGTIHSICYRLLGLNKKLVIDKKDYSNISKELKLSFSESEFERVYSFDNTQFYDDSNLQCNFLIRVDNYIRNKLPFPNVQDYRKLLNELISENYQIKVTEPQHYRFLEKLKVLKHNGKYDFTDMLEGVIINNLYPDVDYLIVDEAQDLSPLMWKVIELFTKNTKDITIYAGDPFQAIYHFNGTNPELFLNVDGKVVFMKKSYRMYPIIIKYVNNYCNYKLMNTQIEEPDNNNNNYIGEIMYIKESDIIDEIISIYNKDKDASIFILARTRFQCDKIANELYKFRLNFTNHNGKDYSFIIKKYNEVSNVIEGIKNNSINVSSLVYIMQFIKGSIYKKYCIRGAKSKIERLNKSFVTINELKFLGFSNSFFTDDLYNLFLSSEELSYCRELKKTNIDIGTIHWSKGREADYVIVNTGITSKIKKSIEENDTEKYVFYVAMTRTRKKLYICKNNNMHNYELY